MFIILELVFVYGSVFVGMLLCCSVVVAVVGIMIVFFICRGYVIVIFMIACGYEFMIAN